MKSKLTDRKLYHNKFNKWCNHKAELKMCVLCDTNTLGENTKDIISVKESVYICDTDFS